MGFTITSGVIIGKNRDKTIRSSGKEGMKSVKASLRSQDKTKKQKKTSEKVSQTCYRSSTPLS